MNDHFSLPAFWRRSCSKVPSRSQRSRTSSSSAFESGSGGSGVNMSRLYGRCCAVPRSGNNEPARPVETLDPSGTHARERNFMPVEATDATFDSEVIENEG